MADAPSQEQGRTRKGVLWTKVVFFLLTPLLLLGPACAQRRAVFGLDLVNVFYFVHEGIVETIRMGRLPVWDSRTLCGFPLLAGVQAAVFYPPSWAGLLLPSPAFWTVMTWAHMALSGLFCYGWLRFGLGLRGAAALIGGTAFMLSGYFVTHLYAGHVNYVWAYPWGPAVLWRMERQLASPTLGRMAYLSLAITMLGLAGVPQLTFAVGLTVITRVLHHSISRTGGPFGPTGATAGVGLAVLAAMLLCAPQLLPTFELASQSQRLTVNCDDFITTYSLPPENLLALVIPTVFGDAVSVPYWGRWYQWETCAYVGLTSIALACVGLTLRHPQKRFWAVWAVGGIALALGRYTPIFWVFRHLVPGATLFRGPSRYLYLFLLAASALAAMGAHRLLTARRGPPQALRPVAGASASLAMLLGAGALALGFLSPESGPWRQITDHAHHMRLKEHIEPLGPCPSPALRASSLQAVRRGFATAALPAALIAAILALHAHGRLRPAVTWVTLLATLSSEMLLFGSRYFQAFDTARMLFPQELVAGIRSRVPQPFRVISLGPDAMQTAGRGRIAGLEHVGGYEPMILTRYAELINTLERRPLAEPLIVALPSRAHPILAMLGASVWTQPAGWPAPKNHIPLGEFDGTVLYHIGGAMPRAWMPGHSIVLTNRSERLAFMADGWDPAMTVVLEESVDRGPVGDPAAGDVVISEWGAGQYTLEVSTRTGGFLVLAEAWYPGWRADINGIEVPILRANHLVQAIQVPPGSHAIRFAYSSTPLRYGLSLAAIPPLAAIAFQLWRYLRIRGQPPRSRQAARAPQ